MSRYRPISKVSFASASGLTHVTSTRVVASSQRFAFIAPSRPLACSPSPDTAENVARPSARTDPFTARSRQSDRRGVDVRPVSRYIGLPRMYGSSSSPRSSTSSVGAARSIDAENILRTAASQGTSARSRVVKAAAEWSERAAWPVGRMSSSARSCAASRAGTASTSRPPPSPGEPAPLRLTV